MLASCVREGKQRQPLITDIPTHRGIRKAREREREVGERLASIRLNEIKRSRNKTMLLQSSEFPLLPLLLSLSTPHAVCQRL